MHDDTREQDLPNGNHVADLGIHLRVEASGPQVSSATTDRRAIPSEVRESIWLAGDGHRVRRVDWQPDAAAPRGSLLFLPGRGDAYEKYLESLGEWHADGWHVTAADWRGQAGSGRLGGDPHTGHIDDFAVWIDDLAAFWSGWQADHPAPHVLAGHSMGGHLVLRAVAERRVDPAVLVLSAPMLGFAGPKLPPSLLHAVARAMRRLGDPARAAWKWSEKPGELPASRQNLLTHDDARYADEVWWREQRPEIVMGPGSWGWVERAYASMRGLFAPGLLETVSTPVLILAAEHDRLVGFDAIAEAARRLPNATLVQFGPEARHELLREVDPVRTRAMTEIARFLDEHAPDQ